MVRFSEKQVVLSPRRCCKTVALMIAELTGDKSVLQTLTNIPDLDPMPQWTYEEALAMRSEININPSKNQLRSDRLII